MIENLLSYIFMLVAGYILLLGTYTGMGIELNTFPQSLVDNKILQILGGYIILREAFPDNLLIVFVILLFYYTSSLILSDNQNRYINIFGPTLGPIIEDQFD